MTGKRVGYKRVSTDEQNPARQLEGIQLDKVFIECESGKTADRTQLNILLEYVREDDIVFVHSMDRMARNLRDLFKLVDDLTGRGIEVRFIKENMTFDGKHDAISRLMLSIMGAVAEFELALIKERQAQGIKIAKELGKYRGRRRVVTPEAIEKVKVDYFSSRKPISHIAVELGISNASVHNCLKEIRKQMQVEINQTQTV